MIDQSGSAGDGGERRPRHLPPPPPPAERHAKGLRQPVLATLLASRAMALLATFILTLQFGMAAAGLPAFPCVVATLTPTHCPGCGVSRSIAALLRGDLATSLSFHAFGIPFLIGGVLIVAAAVLPDRLRDALVARVRAVELRTGITGLVLLGAILYWAFRMTTGHGRIEILG